MKGAKGFNYDAELASVKDLYKEDFDTQVLKTQLLLLKSHLEKSVSDPSSIAYILTYLRSLRASSTVKIVILILVAPATNATSERSFSALRRVKIYLRTTMTQPRLNHLMILNVHKDECDKLSLEQCANHFVAIQSIDVIYLEHFNITLHCCMYGTGVFM